MCGRTESDGSWFFEGVRETTNRRAYFTRSPVDRRRQLQHFAFTEYGYYQRVSGFESGDVVVNPFVVYVAREIAEGLSGTRIDYGDVVHAEDHVTTKQEIRPLNCHVQGSRVNSEMRSD